MKKTCVLAVLAAALPGLAFAGFEIEDATTEENAVEFEIENTVFVGDVNTGDTVSEHEIGVTWGVFNPWTTSVSFELETEKGGTLDLNGFEWSNTIGLVGGEASVNDELAVAIYTSFEYEFDSAEDVNLTVGPAVQYSTGNLDFGLNTFVAIPLDGGEDPAFVYAFGVSSEVSQGIAVGLEAHGEIPRAFGDAAEFEQQSHFLGPVVEIESAEENGQSAEIRLGAFAGLTDATPSVAVSANVGFGF
ncbi:MAG: hypothetical protein AAF479_03415 [Pseudomonadota bacterium]